MTNIPFLRWHGWSSLQMFAAVVCYTNNVSGERAQGCVGSRLSLSCPQMKVIQITAVALGDSYGAGSFCIISEKDCTRNASASHRTDVHRRCDGQSSCIVEVIKEKIPCGYFSSSNNDFERITYNCIESDEPRRITTSTAEEDSSLARTTQSSIKTTQSSINETTNDDACNTTSQKVEQTTDNNGKPDKDKNVVVRVAMLISISIVLIVIILVLIKLRRFMRSARKNSDLLSFKDNEESESQETDLNDYTRSTTPVSSFRSGTSPGITTSEGSGATNCESTSYETPIAVVSNKVSKDSTGSRQKEDDHCNMEPANILSKFRAQVNSLAVDFDESYCNEVSTMLDNGLYCNVDTGQLKRLTSSQGNRSEEVSQQSEYSNVVTTMKTKKPELEVYIPLSTALEIEAISALKNDFEESHYNEVSTILDNGTYCNVETGQLKKSTSSQGNSSEEVLNQSEYCNVVTTMKTRKPQLEVYIPHSKALETAAISALKNDFDEKVDEQSEVNSEGFCSPDYDTMSPGIPEMNFVNKPAPLPIWSLATRTLSREHSEMEKDSERENPYCDMQWSQLRFEQQDSEFEDSTTDSSIDDHICYNAETREPAETGSSKGNNFDEDRKRSEINGVTTKNEMTNATQKPGLDAFNTFNGVAPLTNMLEGELDIDDYDVGSSEIWFTTDEGQMLIENDIYNH